MVCEWDEYTKPTKYIDSDSYIVREIANNLARDASNIVDLARKIFYYVRDGIKYSIYVDYFNRDLYRASVIIKNGYGYCVQKAIVLAALYRAVGIPAKICFADIINHSLSSEVYNLLKTNLFVYHGYTEVYIGGRWIKLTPVFDLGTAIKMNIDPLEFNGYDDVILPKYNKLGKLQFTYVKYRGCYVDPPIEDIINVFKSMYKIT